MTDKTNSDLTSWHYTQDTLLMLSVSVAQIKSILNDGGESVSELVDSFVNLADTFNNLVTHKTDIDHTDLVEVKRQIEHGIVAFQFYDRLSQRLDHVSNSLVQMGTIIGDENKRIDPTQWQAFQQSIESNLTMETERKIFAQILAGVPVEIALKSIQEDSKNADDNIEFF